MKDKYNKSRDRFVRVTTGFIALFLIMLGVVHVIGGRPVYQNAWGLGVFAPVTIIVGLILLFIVIFRWSQFRESALYGNARRKKDEDKHDSSKKHKHWH
jgi:uncharacterized membrane protein